MPRAMVARHATIVRAVGLRLRTEFQFEGSLTAPNIEGIAAVTGKHAVYLSPNGLAPPTHSTTFGCKDLVLPGSGKSRGLRIAAHHRYNGAMRWILIALGVLVLLVALVALIGALLPKGHVTARSAVYRHPPEEVFAALHGFAEYPQWHKDVSKVEILAPADGRERFRETNRFGVITFSVDEAVPPGRMVTRIADPDLPFGGTWTYELVPVPEGTRVTITERGEVYNVFFRFMSRFVFSQHATIDSLLSALGRKFGETVIPGPA